MKTSKEHNPTNFILTAATILLIISGLLNFTATTVNAQTTCKGEMSVCVFEGE